jgi:hypothetical protein
MKLVTGAPIEAGSIRLAEFDSANDGSEAACPDPHSEPDFLGPARSRFDRRPVCSRSLVTTAPSLALFI